MYLYIPLFIFINEAIESYVHRKLRSIDPIHWLMTNLRLLIQDNFKKVSSFEMIWFIKGAYLTVSVIRHMPIIIVTILVNIMSPITFNVMYFLNDVIWVA